MKPPRPAHPLGWLLVALLLLLSFAVGFYFGAGSAALGAVVLSAYP